MSVHKKDAKFVVRWRDDSGRNRSRSFDRRGDADAWETEVRRLRQMGNLQRLTAGKTSLSSYVTGTMDPTHFAHLAPNTQRFYADLLATHILPTLGGVPLRSLTPKRLREWQSTRDRAGAGRYALNRSLDLIGTILQRAAEDGELDSNPARLVRKLEPRRRAAVHPLAPATVETLRLLLDARDRTIVSILAYAGLRPGEVYALRWEDVRERTIHVHAAVDGIGGVKSTKTRSTRSVRLLAPLAADIAAYRLATGPKNTRALIFPVSKGVATRSDMNNWRSRVWRDVWAGAAASAARESGTEPDAPVTRTVDQAPGPKTDRGKSAARRAGFDPDAPPRPYDLRHSFASLLLAEGRTVHYVAQQLGHDARLTLSTYGHVIAEFEDSRTDPENAIREARQGSGSLSVPNTERTGTNNE